MVEVVNDSGFAMAGELVTFVVGEESSDLLTDSYGVARLKLDDTANFGTATWSDQTVPVQGVPQDSLPQIIGYETGYIPSEQESFGSIPATDGALYAYGDELWWMSERRGAIAQHAGTLNGPILGLDSGHIDGDGILDAAVYTATDVYLLRGRPYGGFTVLEQHQVENEEHTVIGVTINQLNADMHGDVAISSSSESETLVTILEGDGSWGFNVRPPYFKPILHQVSLPQMKTMTVIQTSH